MYAPKPLYLNRPRSKNLRCCVNFSFFGGALQATGEPFPVYLLLPSSLILPSSEVLPEDGLCGAERRACSPFQLPLLIAAELEHDAFSSS